jgi:hypothetical protein
MKGVGKIRRHLPALLWYAQRCVRGERGAVFSVRTRDVGWIGVVGWLCIGL